MRDAVYLSAMMHDIGEFVNMAKNSGKVLDHAATSNNVIKNLSMANKNFSTIERLILNHHNPTNSYEKIISAADILSCKEEKYIEVTKSPVEPQPLRPIFMKIKERENKIKGDYGYDINPLNLKDIFPKSRVEFKNLSRKYRALFEEFNKEIKKVKDTTQLLNLLEKYLWCIPTQDIHRNHDVSMYEHAKNAAAIALCLYDQYNAGELTEAMLDDIEQDETRQFILINGDISGIQDFIMTVSSTGAAKSLKSHSIYLSILTDIVVRYILDNLNLKDANLLYSGGGSFFILAPRICEAKMKELKQEIMTNILKAHNGDLFYAIDYIHLSPKDFVNFPYQWQRAVEKVNKQKYLKWNEIDEENKYELIFGPFDEGTEEGGHCSLCGTSYNHRPKGKTKYEDDEIDICSLCNSFITLTEKLRDAKYLYISRCHKTEMNNPKNYKEIFMGFGYEVDFYKEMKKGHGIHYLLNDTNFLSHGCEGFRFGAYSLPKKENNEWVLFDDLAKGSKGDKNLLGILKLDVDNLGSIFGFGLEENKTISRITTLSRMISLYFEGYINQIIKDMNMEKSIYVVYSGGDDTFLIGSWDKVIELAGSFRDKFGEYVCNNQMISFSAGIGIFNNRYPVNRSISITESSLSRAKDFTYGDDELPTKNKVSLLGEVFNWEEFKRIEKVKMLLVDTINKARERRHPSIGRALLHKIQKSTAGFRGILRDSNNGKVDSLRFWKLSYYLREVKEMDEKGNYGRQFAEEIINEYREIVLHNLTKQNKNNSIRNIMIIPVATKLAEMITKDSKED